MIHARTNSLALRMLGRTLFTLVLATSAAGAALLAVERLQLAEESARSTRLLARAAQVSVENALRDNQRLDVDELLERLEIEQGEVNIFVVLGRGAAPWLSSSDRADHPQLIGPLADRAWALGEASGEIDVPGRGPAQVQAFLLRPDDGQPTGMLVLTSPLSSLRQDMQVTALVIAGATLLFAGLVSGALLAGLRHDVLQPLKQIVLATEALGRDLDQPIALPAARTAEVGALSAALLTLRRQLQESRDAAAQASAYRTAAERKLGEADRLVRVGQLAASLAHEIGSPLQVLVGRALMLAAASEAGSEARRQAELIADQAARITRIVGRLHDVVRRRHGAPRPVDLAEPLAQVLWLLEPEARARGVALRPQTLGPPASRVVSADPDELQQLCLNLILNALQASAEGSEVTVELAGADMEVRLVVQDRGHGMTDAVRAKVFEPLFSTRVERGGTGLGLAVVKGIADRLGASIDLQSAAGEGARFELRFPRARR